MEHMSVNASTYVCKAGRFKDIRGSNRVDVALVFLVTKWGRALIKCDFFYPV